MSRKRRAEKIRGNAGAIAPNSARREVAVASAGSQPAEMTPQFGRGPRAGEIRPTGWLCWQSATNLSLFFFSLFSANYQRIVGSRSRTPPHRQLRREFRGLERISLVDRAGNPCRGSRERRRTIREKPRQSIAVMWDWIAATRESIVVSREPIAAARESIGVEREPPAARRDWISLRWDRRAVCRERIPATMPDMNERAGAVVSGA